MGAFGGISFGSFPAKNATISDIEGFGVDLGGYLGAGSVVSGELNSSIGTDDFRLGLTPFGFSDGAGAGGYFQGSFLKIISEFNVKSLVENNLEGFKKTVMYVILKNVFQLSDEEIKVMLEKMYSEAVQNSKTNTSESPQDQDSKKKDEENSDDNEGLNFDDPWKEYDPAYR